MAYWAIRTDRTRSQDLITPELHAGRLRQGWGWAPEQDLRVIREARLAGAGLSDHQRLAWRNWPFLEDEPGGIREGDLLILPNVPRDGRWSIARATAGYSYSEAEKSDDHRHIRHVVLLRESVDPSDPAVAAPLRRSMSRSQCRLWRLDPYADAVKQLLAPRQRSSELEAVDPLRRAADSALELFGEGVAQSFGGAELEDPVRRALEAIYEDVEVSAGPAEHGADFLCRHRDPLGIPHTTAIQLKNWHGTASDHHPLHQLRDAQAHWPGVTACALLTTAEEVSLDFERAREGLQLELGIPVVVYARRDVLRLLLTRTLRGGPDLSDQI